MCFNQTFSVLIVFEEESDRPSAVTAVPGLEVSNLPYFSRHERTFAPTYNCKKTKSLRAFHTDSGNA